MKYKFFFIAAAIVALSGCSSKAVNFNNKIANIESSLRPDAQNAQSNMDDYYKNQEWDKMAKAAKKIESELTDKISELKDLDAPDMEGASAFKKAEVNYLTEMKKMFTCYRKIGEADNDQDRQTEVENYKQITQDVSDAQQEVKRTQSTFAKSNDMKIKDQDNNTDDDKTTKKKKSGDE